MIRNKKWAVTVMVIGNFMAMLSARWKNVEDIAGYVKAPLFVFGFMLFAWGAVSLVGIMRKPSDGIEHVSDKGISHVEDADEPLGES